MAAGTEVAPGGLRWGALITVSAAIVYAFAFPSLESRFGAGVVGLAVAPISSAAIAFGTRGGLVGGVAALIGNALFLAVLHPHLGVLAVLRADGAAGALTLPFVGLALGRLRDLEIDHWRELRQRRWTERMLAENRRRFDFVVRNVDVLLFALDQTGRFTFLQGRAAAKFGADPTELRGRSAIDFFHDEPQVRQQIRMALAGESAEPAIVRLSNDTLYEVRCMPVHDDKGRLEGVTGIALDVSHRSQLERIQELSEAKSSFLAAMSHELRTPLNAVLGFAQLLSSQGGLDDRQRRYVHHIETAGQHLLALVSDVLDLSKVDAGRMDVELVPLQLAEVIKDAVADVRPLAEEKGLALRMDVQPGLVVMADRRRLFQVVLNLLSNAVKFTPAGEVLVRSRQAGEVAEVFVIDTGVGIAAEEQDRIFDEFYQAHAKLTQPQQGTGLGLALCRRLIGLMAGSIGVSSIVGVGSTFTVRLPMAAAASTSVEKTA